MTVGFNIMSSLSIFLYLRHRWNWVNGSNPWPEIYFPTCRPSDILEFWVSGVWVSL